MNILRSGVVLAGVMSMLAACGKDGAGGGEATTADPARGKSAQARSTHHKVLVHADQKELLDELHRARAVVREHTYGSFSVLVVDEAALGGPAAIARLGLEVREDYDLIRIDGYPIDTRDPEGSYQKMGIPFRRTPAEVPGLYLVQLVAPVKDEWRSALEDEGLEVVTYMPENSYVVRADIRGVRQLARLLERGELVQFVARYEPSFKIAPQLRGATPGVKLDLTVQIARGADLKSTLAAVGELATRVEDDWSAGDFHNVALTADSARIADLASLDDVFAVEPRPERRLLDEAQGQIVAGNLSGASPTGPGYLDFLAQKGFNSAQFGTFVVHIVDDSHLVTGHPDLATSRVVFQNNPTSATGSQGGHGFLNTHIIGGINSGTGTANEDTSGYNYGLGIAPYARVGVSDIFGNGFSTPTLWESTAYGSGARISSNSWGYISTYDYDASAQEFDRIVRDAQTAAGLQQLTVVFAAGNDGAGANTVSSPATAKNVITVGASENVRQTGTDGCLIGNTGANDARDIISFSSRGPVNTAGGDGRIKPDIVAPGTHVEAGVPQSSYNGSSVCNQYWPTGQTLYGWSSGTSHSCPAVAGGAALVYQDFLNRALAAPSPAMVKAYLMSSAAYMTGVGANDTLPSNTQGLGRMDLGRAFDGTARILVDQTRVFAATGETHVVSGSIADTSRPFRVVLAWTDAAGPTTGAPWVNNLNLTVTVGGQTYVGNVFSGANSITGGAADTRNNVESVFLPAGTSGSFTVTVTAASVGGDGVTGNADTTDQDFALLIYNASDTALPPAIGAAPSSMSFSATSGGANPASQALSITNTGGGSLAWSATTDQTWLTLSASSGTAPSTPNVSVNISGLAAGTYSGNVTITAAGATNSPLVVPVSLTINAVAAPAIGVSPASMTFVATTGGANPANQTLTVSNTGGGSLAWTGVSNQTWLTIAPASGTAPTTVTVSANVAGLAAGTYNGTITLTSAGASNSPVTVPVTFTVNAAGTEYLGNGGLEVVQAPWLRNGAGTFYTANGASPHGGTGYMYLGSLNSVAGVVGQQLTIPAGATSANLTYWLRITTAETTTTVQADRLFVEIRTTSGALLATAATFSNLNAAAYSSYAQPASFNLLPWAGQTIRVTWRLTTNGTNVTTFYLDDASIR